jgi:hypothetical protein
MKAALREVLVFLIWLPFALPTGVIYGRFLVDVMDRNLGLAGGALVIALPAAMLLFALAIWLPVWGFWRQSRRKRLGWLAPLTAAVLATMAAFALCSRDCFLPDGPEPFLAYFMAVPASLAAFLHDRWSRAWPPAPDETGA